MRDAKKNKKRKGEAGRCNCKSDMKCLKKYCVCRRANISCTLECKCTDCKNGRPVPYEGESSSKKKKQKIKRR